MISFNEIRGPVIKLLALGLRDYPPKNGIRAAVYRMSIKTQQCPLDH